MQAEELSIVDAAHRLGVDQATIRRRLKTGRLRGRRIPTPQGYRWLVEVDLASSSVDAGERRFLEQGDTSAQRSLLQGVIEALAAQGRAIEGLRATVLDELPARSRVGAQVRPLDSAAADVLAAVATELSSPLSVLTLGLDLLGVAPGDDAIAAASRTMRPELEHLDRLAAMLAELARAFRPGKVVTMALSDLVASATQAGASCDVTLEEGAVLLLRQLGSDRMTTVEVHSTDLELAVDTPELAAIEGSPLAALVATFGAHARTLTGKLACLELHLRRTGTGVEVRDGRALIRLRPEVSRTG